MPLKSKTQAIRIADVLFIGPVMALGGVALAHKKRKVLGSVLAVLGVLTMTYNAKNYLLNRRITP